MSAPTEWSQGPTGGRSRQHAGAGNGSSSAHVYGCADAACVQVLGDGVRIVAGNAGDHPLVLKLLVETRHAALGEDFQSRLDEPSYRPSDRLLVRRERDLVAHVHVADHIAWFEGQRVPVVKLQDFAALPEFSSAGYGERLLDSAEDIAAGEGAVVGIVHAETPEFFARRGWSLLRGQGHTRANARAVLAHLDAQDAARRRLKRTPLTVRTWRHFELDAVRSLYHLFAVDQWGPLLRSELGWQWLIGRKAQDQILLAVEDRAAGGNDLPPDDVHACGKVVGYAVVRGSCIIEMATLEEFAAAQTQLLARACQDAMDRDHNSISLFTPASDPLHELLVTAGGQWISDAGAGRARWMAKLLAPEKWTERFYPAWHERARAAGIARPWELGFDLGEDRYRFTLTRRSARLERVAELPADWVACARPIMDSLLLSNLSIPAALTAGRLQVSSERVAEALAAVFPPRLFWQSPLELLRV